MSAFLSTHSRTHSCGQLRAADVGKSVVLTGWVQTYRDHGKAVFIDLRDRDGVTQLVFDPSFDGGPLEVAGTLRAEWCIGVVGEVRARGERLDKTGKMKSMVNEKLATGEVEVWVHAIEVFSKAETLPFEIKD